MHLPEIRVQELPEGGWRAWVEGSKLSVVEESRGMAMRVIKEFWNEKLECDAYLEDYAKRLARGR